MSSPAPSVKTEPEVPGTKLGNASNSAYLPPCRICGDKASGFHYGANTCEACKGFFRRSLKRSTELKCPHQGNCVVTSSRRHTCPACRFKKCLEAGMSKTAIKTGRYTHEKKTRDIQEVKQLEIKARMKDDGSMMLSLEDREKELEKIINQITAVHLEQTPHTPEFFAKLPEREAKFLEQRELREKMFGTMKPLGRDEYRKIYQSTGIDIDGRREMITHMIPSIEKAIKRFIRFAKALPGFKDLPVDDQIALIKGNRYEFDKIFAMKLFNVQHRTLANPWYPGDPLIMDENTLRLFTNDETYINMEFTIAERLQRFNFTNEEVAMLMGCLILTSESRLDAPLIQHSHLCNRDVGTVYCFMSQSMRLDSDYLKMYGEFEVHGIIKKLLLATQDLDLTPEEQALTVAVSIMATPITLSHIGTIIRDASLDTLGEALWSLLVKSCDSPGIQMGKLVHLINEFKTMQALYIDNTNLRLVQEHPDLFLGEDSQWWFQWAGLSKDIIRCCQEERDDK